jgi:hypothetical protein
MEDRMSSLTTAQIATLLLMFLVLVVLAAGVLVASGVLAVLGGVRRWWVRRAIRKELQLLRGGKAAPMFTTYGELEDRTPRPPIRSLRTRRGDHDAA